MVECTIILSKKGMKKMIKSMTGFGRGENSDGLHNFTVEIKTLNHRYNDIIVKMPKHISYFEESVKKIIKEKINRGRVEVFISLEYVNQSAIDIKVDIPLAKSYKQAIESIAGELNIDEQVSLDQIVGITDVIKAEKREEDDAQIWICLKGALEEAIDKMMIMRSEEGKELAKDITMKSANITEMVKEIEKRAPLVVLEYKEKLKARVEELLEKEYKIDDSKLANEVAFFADKSSINEEIVRLYSHINQIISSLQMEEPVGRKLDFLVQEMNREINTIGSKASDLEITKLVVDVKSEIEKIREQIQNVE